MKHRLIWILVLCAASQAIASLYFYSGKRPDISFDTILTLSRKALQASVPDHREYNPVLASLYGMPGKDSGRWNIIFVNKAQRSYNVNTVFPEIETKVDLYSSNDLYNIFVDADMTTEYANALATLSESQRREFYCCGAYRDRKAALFRFEFASGTNWKSRLIVDNHSVTNRTM